MALASCSAAVAVAAGVTSRWSYVSRMYYGRVRRIACMVVIRVAVVNVAVVSMVVVSWRRALTRLGNRWSLLLALDSERIRSRAGAKVSTHVAAAKGEEPGWLLRHLG